jgi:hypothetical protein
LNRARRRVGGGWLTRRRDDAKNTKDEFNRETLERREKRDRIYKMNRMKHGGWNLVPGLGEPGHQSRGFGVGKVLSSSFQWSFLQADGEFQRIPVRKYVDRRSSN